jgi:tripartite-type tricarboxylate transporter receptor subunit TctC
MGRMEGTRMSHVVRFVFTAVLSLLVPTVQAVAENYPDRVVRIINPYPPGGSVDVMARILAQKLTEALGQQVIVENRSGGGGNTGSDFVAKSEPDGYTLLFTAPGPLTVNQTLYDKLPFDPAKDFAPVALFATAPIVLIVNPGVPAHNVQELIALARKQPGKINFASAGIGTTNHLSGELFKSMAKIDIVHVPYRGAGPAMNDLVAGHVQMFFDLMPVVLPQIAAGNVRPLANAGGKRPSALPNVPTVAEQGLAGFDASSWYGLVAPAKRFSFAKPKSDDIKSTYFRYADADLVSVAEDVELVFGAFFEGDGGMQAYAAFGDVGDEDFVAVKFLAPNQP